MRDPKTRPLQSPFWLKGNNIGLAFGVNEKSKGITNLTITPELESAWFEHGVVDVDGEVGSGIGEFEGFCPFGVGEVGVERIDVEKVEVWGSE